MTGSRAIAAKWSEKNHFRPARATRGAFAISRTVLFTSPRQQAPDGFRTSHASRPDLTAAMTRAAMALWPACAISRETSARSNPRQ